MGVNPIHYWTSGNTAEVDFVIQLDELILPVEVKSGLNVRSHSMQVYRGRYIPKVAVRFSMQNLKHDNGLLNVPLYLIDQLPEFIKIISAPD
jgi:predicted AAA+ superfamily ATPase